MMNSSLVFSLRVVRMVAHCLRVRRYIDDCLQYIVLYHNK